MDNEDKSNQLKSFLVQFKERRVKFEIQEGTVNTKELHEMISEKLCIATKFRVQYEDKRFGDNVYIELEDIQEIPNFGKVQVIVDEEIKTVLPIPNVSQILPTEDKKIDVDVEKYQELLDCETVSTASTESYSSVVHSSSSRVINKCEPARNTWHLTWSLPKFPAALEEALKDRKLLTSTQKDLIITLLYNDIYPRSDFYPKVAQYDHVISVLLEAYPKLAVDNCSNSGVAFNYWKVKLRTKFKNYRDVDGSKNIYVLERKLKRSRISDSGEENEDSAPKRSKQNLAWGVENYLPDFAPGESEETALKYKELIKKSLKERNPDGRKVAEYMDRSFAQRRREIIVSKLSCCKIIEMYPPLLDRAEIICEFKRVVGKEAVTLPKFKEALASEFKPLNAIFALRKKKCANQRVVELRKKHDETRSPDEYIEVEMELAIHLIPILLRETLSAFLDPTAENLPPVHITTKENTYDLNVEGTIVTQISTLVDAVYLYMTAFYIYNLKYQQKSCKTEEYFQRKLLKISDNNRINNSVAALLLKTEELSKSY